MLESQTPPGVPLLGAEICPYLGLEEDPQTCLAYPSPWNLCHRSMPAAVVRLGHQSNVCLTAAHTGCPVFQREQKAPLPAGLRSRRNAIE